MGCWSEAVPYSGPYVAFWFKTRAHGLQVSRAPRVGLHSVRPGPKVESVDRMGRKRKRESDRIVFDAAEEKMPVADKLNLWMKRYGMLEPHCEGITVNHLLTTCFRDHLPDHLRGRGSSAKVKAWLETIGWISVSDYHGEAAFCYSEKVFFVCYSK